MSSRPRRSAATRANEVISEHARWADSSERSDREQSSRTSHMSSRRSARASGASMIHDESHSSAAKASPSSSKIRQSARASSSRRSEPFEGGEILTGKRNRSQKKSYVVDSSPDDDDEVEDEPELDDDDEEDEVDEDAEGEDEMDVDAEGKEVDADGDIAMDQPPTPPVKATIRVRTGPARTSTGKIPASEPSDEEDEDEEEEEEEDDDDLSDPADSELGDTTMGLGDQTLGEGEDEDAEGEEIEEQEDADGEDVEDVEEGGEGPTGLELGSDDEDMDGSVDLNKMTKRQRARFEDEPQEYMKLSDEVQAKKVFTAEELSMRRQEMARRRRNLSDKRNEEVKMETINKLLKKQAPKVNRKAAAAQAAAAAEASDENGGPKVNPAIIRWVSKKDGFQLGVPRVMLESPAGTVFGNGMKKVEEVA